MKYFTIEELTSSAEAQKRSIDNTPNSNALYNLILLVDSTLDPAREEYGRAVRVNSGYRSKELNAAIGGAATSQHTKGQAADVRCADNALLFRIIRKQGNFDQLIWEFGDHEQPSWVHVSYVSQDANRHEVLRAVKQFDGRTKYIKL